MKNLLYILLAVVTLASCTKDFEEINTNKDQAEAVVGSLLLPTIIGDYADLQINSNQGFGDIVGQYTSNYEFTNIDVYNWSADNTYWGIYTILQNVKDVETYGSTSGNTNYIAVAKILRAYGVSILTDVYGNVPYTEANRAPEGDSFLAPKYDEQKDIYNGLMNELMEANEMINAAGSINGDILFNGDMMKWKRFANSLRLRLLMRSSNAQDNKAAMAAIVANPEQYPLILTASDNAEYKFSGNFPDISPQAVGRGREYDYYLGAASANIINTLKGNNDPRMQAWFDAAKATGEYQGLPSGLALGEQINNAGGRDGNASKAASFFNDPAKATAIFITASEVNFILAEAAQNGDISGDAKGYYDTAVTESFAQWGVTMPADFTTNVPYNAENLAVQKWVSLYQNSLQGWMDWKRTGLPTFLQAGPANINNGKIPVRQLYPSIEQSVNKENYNKASTAIGGDNINSRVWWDK